VVSDQIARQREDFVSQLTHDLRTPSSGRSDADAFQQGALGELSPTMQEAIATMARSKLLLQMVNTYWRFTASKPVAKSDLLS